MALAPIVEAFQWGKGGAKMSPEEIAREREIAQALMQVDTSPVGHWSQGLARVANAAAGAFKDYRAGQAEKGNAAFNSDIVASLLGGGASIAPSLPSAMSGNAGTVAGGSALASLPTGERADYIRTGLLKRGLPEHVADAFILNFQDESGLNPGINERNPIVPGSRGGYGLYQLTGPRRRAYEAFAAERGVDPSDTDAQLDFLMLEGQGPEKAAFEAILSAPDTGTAAAAIVNKFLRPAEEHRVSRANRYMSYGGAATPAAVDAVNAMAAGQQNIPAEVGDAMGRNFQARPGMVIDPSDIASLSAPVDPVAVAENEADVVAMETAMAAQDPSAFAVNPVAEALTTSAIPPPDANPNAAVASSLTRHAVNPDLPMAGGTSGFAPIAQAMQAPQQAQGGGMQQAIIQALSDPRASDQTRNIASILLQQQMQQQDPMRQLEMDYKRAQLDQLRNPQPQQTAEMQNLAWRAQQAGLQPGSPEYTQFMMTGGRNDGITVNNVMGGEKFGEEFAKGDASALAEVSQAGLAAQRNLGRIDRLDQILQNTPQGAMASWQQLAGQYGINTEGLDNIQAAQALINALVPEQRPPGSGPMSDADLELFKQSLPRIINQPGGNQMIINTMRSIGQYDAQGAEIVQALRRGEIDRAQAFDMLQGRANPLAGLNDVATPSNAPKRWERDGYIIEQVD